MAVIFYLASLLFSLGQLGRISLSNNQINFYLYEVFLVLVFFCLLVKLKLSPLRSAYKKYKIVFIFFLWLLFTNLFGITSFSFQENIVSLLYLLRLIFYPLFFLYLSHLNLKKDTIKNGLVIFIAVTIFSSFIKYQSSINSIFIVSDCVLLIGYI